MSLPSRERGLKYVQRGGNGEASQSLPSRERGLKYLLVRVIYGDGQSLPSRERGLKYMVNLFPEYAHLVAPFTGAWIEISFAKPCPPTLIVAPFTGAWIEIRDAKALDDAKAGRSLHGSVD